MKGEQVHDQMWVKTLFANNYSNPEQHNMHLKWQDFKD